MYARGRCKKRSINEKQKRAGTRWRDRGGIFSEKQGVRILVHNYQCRWGEIDLIGQEENTLLIVEVKTRTSSRQGYPCEAVDVRKQRKICRVYDHFRMERRLDDCQPVRFDVVEVVETVGGYYCRWIKNAFEYQGM